MGALRVIFAVTYGTLFWKKRRLAFHLPKKNTGEGASSVPGLCYQNPEQEYVPDTIGLREKTP
jgi:hypothetical protein